MEIANGILKALRNKLPCSCSRFLLTFCGVLYVRVVKNRSGADQMEHGITAEIGQGGQWSAGSTTILLTHDSDLIYAL